MKMNPVFGKGTGVRLDQAGALFLRDEQHPEMPRLTRQGIQLSAEMVSSTYSLSLEDWQQAGWQDAVRPNTVGEVPEARGEQHARKACTREHST